VKNLIEQLRRRALFQWALAYLGGAWLLLQIVDTIAEPWGLSDGIERGIQISLVLGFLLTVVLSWYHGERGQQRVTGTELLLVTLLLGAAGILVPRAMSPRGSDAAAAATTALEPRSIAVLPFADLSASEDQAYFGEGMAEEILSGLSRIPGLRVSARTSAFLLRNDDIATVGARLGVSTVLEGSVRREGDLVRISVQLIDVATESYLWSGEYDRRGGAVLAIQDEIAQEVARALEFELGVGGDGVLLANTANPIAYDLYLRGRYEWNQRTPEAFRRALGFFEDALAADPNYAVAYSGLADTYVLLFEYQRIPLEEAIPAATAAARRALSLEAGLGEARTSMGEILAAQREWAAAEVEYEQALDLSPGYATGHHWYGYFLSHLGRHEEAIAHLRMGKDLDPLSAVIRRDLAAALFHARDFEGALTEAAECERLALQPPWCAGMAAIRLRALEAVGRHIEAERQAVEMRDGSAILQVDALMDLPRIWAGMGRLAEARSQLAVERERAGDRLPGGSSPAFHVWIAEVLVALGDHEAAYAELDLAMDLGFAIGPVLLRGWPPFDPLRGTDRFEAILERMRYP
jgi:TolB-like protein